MEIFWLLGIPLAGGTFLALWGCRSYAPEINALFSFLTLLAAALLTHRIIERGPDDGGRGLVLHRLVQRLPGRAHRLRRLHHGAVLASLHAHRAGARPAQRAASAPLPQQLSDLHRRHAAGADHQQHGHPVGVDGGGDARHRAAGVAVPHPGFAGGGLEILHPVRRRHRAGAVRHHPALLRGGKSAGLGRHGAAVDAPERRQGATGTHGAVTGFRLPAGRLRHQGRPGAPAQLAAGRPRRRPDAGVRRALRPAAQRRAVCGDALQGAGRRRARQRHGRQPDDGLRPLLGGAGRLPDQAPDRRQAHVRLLLDRAHGPHHLRLRHGRRGGELRRRCCT